jgi:hypothetical protein
MLAWLIARISLRCVSPFASRVAIACSKLRYVSSESRGRSATRSPAANAATIIRNAASAPDRNRAGSKFRSTCRIRTSTAPTGLAGSGSGRAGAAGSIVPSTTGPTGRPMPGTCTGPRSARERSNPVRRPRILRSRSTRNAAIMPNSRRSIGKLPLPIALILCQSPT